MELQFFKKGELSYFTIRQLPKKVKTRVLSNYFVAYFCCKRVKKELFKLDLKDKYFRGFLIENVGDNGSRIVIATRKPFVPVFKYSGDNRSIVVKPVEEKRRVKKAPPPPPVPKELTATPFYISGYVFYKKITPGGRSYDESLFFMGVKYFTLKNYAYALSFFKEIIKKYPQSPFYVSSYFLLGDCYMKMKEYQKALEAYSKAVKLSPKNSTVAQTLFNMAEIYRKLGYYSQARMVYQTIVRDYMNTKWADRALYLLARTYYEQKNYKKALDELMKIKKKSSYYPVAMLLAAEIFIKQKNIPKAVLAYYALSENLNRINIDNHYRELIDVASALCRFEDYTSADRIFGYVEKSGNENIIVHAYLGKMRCDLYRGDYKDLKEKARYVLSKTRNKKLIREVNKLLDEAKLKEGKISDNVIKEILRKYANDPDIAALALYVYAKKSYRQSEYRKALNYLLRLKRLYPNSEYNSRAKVIAEEAIGKLVDEFYSFPNSSLIDYIYSVVAHLKVYSKACRIAVGLMIMEEYEKMHSLLPFVGDENCKNVLYAKYYVEAGNESKALTYLGRVEETAPYIYYTDIVMGDINYFKGRYDKAYEFYLKASKIELKAVSEYAVLQAMKALFSEGKYDDVVRLSDGITLKLFLNKALLLKAKALFELGRYSESADLFGQLASAVEYKEQALFYLALDYAKLGKRDEARKYYDELKKLYPESEYLKTLKVVME